jgi:hypothetical protein
MSLFAERKDVRVRNFLLKLINTNCPGLKATVEGPRLDSRINMSVAVLVVPVEAGRLQVAEAFTAMTREFSNSGVGIVLDQPEGPDEAVLGFQLEGTMTFLRAEGKHLESLGGGFYHLGLHLTEIVTPVDYPELRSLKL